MSLIPIIDANDGVSKEKQVSPPTSAPVDKSIDEEARRKRTLLNDLAKQFSEKYGDAWGTDPLATLKKMREESSQVW